MDVLAGDREVIECVAIEFTNAVAKTLSLESPEVALDNAVSAGTTSVESESLDLNIQNIEKLPELVSSAIDAELQKQFQVLNASSKELIVNSMNDLMRFFQEKVSQILEPLKHPVSLDAG